MRAFVKWLAPVVVVAGLGAAAAFGEDAPLAPRNLALHPQGPGAGWSTDGQNWTGVDPAHAWYDLTLVQATFVKGPAIIRVTAGTTVEVDAGEVVRVSWEPAVRGWRFMALIGDAKACFTNTCASIPEGTSITLTNANRPRGPFTPVVLPRILHEEVSGFEDQEHI
jgi:hypothetical protein